MCCGLTALLVGVYVTEHVPDASAHCPELLKLPPPSVENVTVPAGVEPPSPPLSVTVAVHAVPCPAVTGEVQLTDVAVPRVFTTRLNAVAVLLLWTLSLAA